MASTVSALRDLVSHFSPSLLFLCETKAKRSRIQYLCNVSAYDKYFAVDAIGISGGLALFWKSNMEVEVLAVCKNYIHSKVVMKDVNLFCYVTCVYGDPEPNARRVVWQNISNLRVPNNCAWGCIGDFNDILAQSEKEGVRPRDSHTIDVFREFLDSNNLMDMHLKGCRFTWYNNRSEGHVKERIDRVLTNSRWQTFFPDATLTALPAIGSDHSPLVLQLSPVEGRRQKIFKYQDFWESHAEFKEMLQQNWTAEKDSNFQQKLLKITKHLEGWSKAKFRRADIEIKKMKNRVQRLENEPFSPQVLEELKMCKLELDNLWSQEEQFWKAKSRVNWLKHGDCNSKFFHASTLQRRAKNKITRLKSSEGVWVETQRNLEDLIWGHFTNLFKSSNPTNAANVTRLIPRGISEGMNAMLLRHVEEREVKKAVFGMGPQKSPGPDGLIGAFFQNNWDVVKDEVVETVRIFFQTAKLPLKMNTTHITLVPKIGNPEDLGQFRPINCCNFMYKVISKVLTDRMKGLLPVLISENQSAFVGGRLIQDNIVVAHEIFHSLRCKSRGGKNFLAVKLDMNKAYDRLEWSFVKEVLSAYGFHEHWIALIMECITTVTYKAMLNGTTGPMIYPERGLRQGDPISPYLFIIAAEGLNVLMKDAIEGGRISGVKLKANAPLLSSLMFADDTMLVTKAERCEAYELVNILNTYMNASGQRINVSKSGVMCSQDVDVRKRNIIATILNMPLCSSPSKYLGLPGEWQRSKTQALQWLKERIWNKLQGWKEKLLSPAGKEVLIKAVIQAMPSYVMSVFLLPKNFCDDISRMVSRFWWSQSNRDRGIHWVSWKNMKKSKCVDGLGFRDFHAMNLALLGKQVWRIQNELNALWVRVLKSLYFPNNSIWSARKGNNPSWALRSLLKARDFVDKHKVWMVKNGENITAFEDKWLCNGEKIWATDAACNILKVKDLLEDNGRTWSTRKLAQHLPNHYAKLALSTPICNHLDSDTPIWPHTRSGSYSVKTGYHIALDDVVFRNEGSPSNSDGNKAIWKEVWGAKVLPKVKLFAWKALQGILPTIVNLWRRKIPIDSFCPVCKMKDESEDHLLFGCEWVRAVWFGSQFSWSGSNEDSSFGQERLHRKILEFSKMGEDKDSKLALFFNYLWSIWKARNEYCFEGRVINPEFVIRRAEANWKDFWEANGKEATDSLPGPVSLSDSHKWKPPTTGELKINCDGSFCAENLKGALAVIVRDEDGDFLTGSSRCFPCNSPLHAEGMAIDEALDLILAIDIRKAIVESDCLEVVKSCENDPIPWQICSIVKEIRRKVRQHGNVKVNWIRREANKSADVVAMMNLKGDLPVVWRWLRPIKLRVALLEDRIVCNSSSSMPSA